MLTEKELNEFRRNIDNELKRLEHAIYELEGTYLDKTGNTGNLIKGWDLQAYLKNHRNSNLQPLPPPKKQKPLDKDRLFSLSSLTSEVHRNLPPEPIPEASPGRPKKIKKQGTHQKGRKPSRVISEDSRESWKESDKQAHKPKPALKKTQSNKANKPPKPTVKKQKKNNKKQVS